MSPRSYLPLVLGYFRYLSSNSKPVPNVGAKQTNKQTVTLTFMCVWQRLNWTVLLLVSLGVPHEVDHVITRVRTF